MGITRGRLLQILYELVVQQNSLRQLKHEGLMFVYKFAWYELTGDEMSGFR